MDWDGAQTLTPAETLDCMHESVILAHSCPLGTRPHPSFSCLDQLPNLALDDDTFPPRAPAMRRSFLLIGALCGAATASNDAWSTEEVVGDAETVYGRFLSESGSGSGSPPSPPPPSPPPPSPSPPLSPSPPPPSPSPPPPPSSPPTPPPPQPVSAGTTRETVITNGASFTVATVISYTEMTSMATTAKAQTAAQTGKPLDKVDATMVGGTGFPGCSTGSCEKSVCLEGGGCSRSLNGYAVTDTRCGAVSDADLIALVEPLCSGRRLDDAGQARRELQTGSVPYSMFITATVEVQPDGTSDESSLTAAMMSLPTATIVTNAASAAAVTVSSVTVTATAAITTSEPVTAPPPPSPAVGPAVEDGGVPEVTWTASCVTSCNTFEDGATMYTPQLCAKFEGVNYIRCKPTYSGFCDSGMELCTNTLSAPPSPPPPTTCEDKQDKKGKWRTKKCPNKVAVKATKCNKKKIKRKCKKTCCVAGY